ncbi:MAG: DUF1513 domain-containing protein [Pseudomonadota bacterium]
MFARRSILAGMIAACLAPKSTWAEAGNPAFLSAARAADGSYVLCGLSETGDITFRIDLPARGHAAAAHPMRPHAVAFARRPGSFAMVLDCASGDVLQRLHAPVGRHFYGHGTFTNDGEILATTENDFEAGSGVIGLWDARNGYVRIGEIPSGGVGPHDIRTLSDGTFAVANGGIETHPETGRTKLNIPTMRPNLSYVSVDGDVLDVVELARELHKNSIRHLAVSTSGQVAMGLQWQGDVADKVPLVALHDRATGSLLLNQSHSSKQMKGYVGSVAMSNDKIAVTSPRGATVQILHAQDLSVLQKDSLRDVCGVAHMSAGFVITSGSGDFQVLGDGVRAKQATLSWDNHLVELRAGQRL